MTSSTKKRIVETAIALFNESGYESISLRDIAKAAGTTIGNLTYHFHHKEDLLVAIQQQIEVDFLSFADDSAASGEEALKELIKIFDKSAALKTHNKFFFMDFESIVGDNQTLRTTVQSFRNRLYIAYQQCFDKMVKFDIFRQDLSKQQYDELILVLLTMDYAWEMRYSPKYEFKLAVDTATLSINTIYPYLTLKGRQICDGITDVKH